jgi:hypothetical protein
MNGSALGVVRSFVRGHAEGRKVPGGIPAALKGYARAAMRGVRTSVLVSADDVVAEFLLKLCSGAWRDVCWDALSDGAFEARLRKSMRDVVVEQTEGWTARKALREMVAAVMASGLPPAPPSPPGSLCSGERYSSERVGLAAAWLLGLRVTEADPSSVTETLLRLYAPAFQSLTAANDDTEPFVVPDGRDPFEEVSTALDAPLAARLFVETLASEKLRVLVARMRGEPLRVIAEREACCIAAVHHRATEASADVRDLAEEHGFDAGVVLRALELVED